MKRRDCRRQGLERSIDGRGNAELRSRTSTGSWKFSSIVADDFSVLVTTCRGYRNAPNRLLEHSRNLIETLLRCFVLILHWQLRQAKTPVFREICRKLSSENF